MSDTMEEKKNQALQCVYGEYPKDRIMKDLTLIIDSYFIFEIYLTEGGYLKSQIEFIQACDVLKDFFGLKEWIE